MTSTTIRRPGRTRAADTEQAFLHLILVVAALIVALPTLWLFMSSFKTSDELLRSPWALPRHWTLHNFTTAWTTINLGRLLTNSLLVCASATALTLLMGLLMSYAIAFRRSYYTRAAYGLFLGALFLPTDLMLLPIYVELRSLHLLNNYLGVILPYSVFALPLAVLLITQSMRALPKGLIEAARIDGASPWTTLWRVVVPLIKPTVGAVVVLTVIANWNEFLVALLVLQKPGMQTIPVGLASFTAITTPRPDLLLASVTVSMLPTLLIFVLFQRSINRGVIAGAIK